MSKVAALKRFAAVLTGTNINLFKGETVVEVLKELQVFHGDVPSTNKIKLYTVDEMLNSLADNWPSGDPYEPFEYFNYSSNKVNVVVTLNGVEIEPEVECLYNGDEVVINATLKEEYQEDYVIQYSRIGLGSTSIPFTSGDTFTINNSCFSVIVEGTQLVDLAINATNCTVSVVDADGNTFEAGSKVLPKTNWLQSFVNINVTPNEGYELSTLTVNGQTIENGAQVEVTGNISVVATCTAIQTGYDLTVSNDGSGQITVTRNEITVEPGSNVLQAGDVLTIEVSNWLGHVIDSLTVNNETFTSGSTHVVDGNVNIVLTGHEITYNLTVNATNCDVELVKDNIVSKVVLIPGVDTISQGNVLGVNVTPHDGFGNAQVTATNCEVTTPSKSQYAFDSFTGDIVVTASCTAV